MQTQHNSAHASIETIEWTHKFNRCLSICSCIMNTESKVCLSETICVNVLLLLGFSFSCTEIRRHMMFDHVASFMQDLRRGTFKGADLNKYIYI